MYKTTHGLTHTPEYHAWSDAKNRCHTPTSRYWPKYGGRGIKMCERWRNDFTTFWKDMGQKPLPSLTLERLDNDKGYEPGNCTWATRVQQNNNRAVCRQKIVVDGVLLTIKEAARAAGVRYQTALDRQKAGFSVEQILSRTPLYR